MITLTHYFKTLLWACILIGAKTSIAQSPCSANFTYAINPAGNVTFSSTSTGTSITTQYQWWGYGYDPSTGVLVSSFYSTSMNPSYTFSVNGAYTISMSMSNSAPSCSSNASPQVIVITNTTVPCNPYVNFSCVSSGPGSVNFNPYALGTVAGTTYSWNFGDNTSSTSTSPSHTYSADGAYLATLTIDNTGVGTCTAAATQTVQICTVNPMTASFLYSVDPGGVVNFTSTSTGTNVNTNYYWDGNNNNSVSGTNITQPTITYSANGIYTVSLWLYNANTGCSANASQTIIVTNTLTPCNLSASVSLTQGTLGNVNFMANASGTVLGTTYSWNFGDNTTSSVMSPAHTYSADGIYSTTLTVNNNNVIGTCTAVVVQTVQVCSVNPMISSFIYSLNPAGVVNFSSTSTGTTGFTSFIWNSSNNIWLNGANQQPIITYTVNGTYTVSLGIVNSLTGCNAFSSQTIAISNTATPCNLTANISYIQTGAGGINFTAITSGTVPGATYSWNFGDNTNSTTMSPAHTYSANGGYIATLTVNNNGLGTCTAVATQTVQICNVTPVTASFVYSVNPGGVVNFTSTSTGTTANTYYIWGSNNGTFFSGTNIIQPTITYTANGVYTASLSIYTAGCNAYYSQTIAINTAAGPCNLAANYSYAAGGGAGVVNFNNSSTGAVPGVTYSWSFGDNTASTATSPSHTYTADGYYVVTLTANNNSPNPCTSTTTQTIQVCSVNPMTASFIYSVNPNGVVNFTSTSTGTSANTYYNWGSNNIVNWTMLYGTNLIQPTITYSANGAYTATLGIYNPSTGCSAYTSQTIVVTNTACIADGGFNLFPSGTPQVWNAFPFNPANVSSAVWNWGDGSSSNTLYTSHTYSAAGMYSICLSVTVACGASDTFCTSYNIYRSAEDLNIVQINVMDPATVGIKGKSTEAISYIISPNPNSGAFNLKIDGITSGKATIQIYDAIGKLIYNEMNETNNGSLTKDIDLMDVSNGVYYLRINSEKSSVNKKIIINK